MKSLDTQALQELYESPYAELGPTDVLSAGTESASVIISLYNSLRCRPGRWSREREDAEKKVGDLFGLQPVHADVLAILLCSRIYEGKTSQIERLLRLSEWETRSAVSSLVKRGLVCLSEEDGLNLEEEADLTELVGTCLHPRYVPTDELSLAIDEDMPFREAVRRCQLDAFSHAVSTQVTSGMTREMVYRVDAVLHHHPDTVFGSRLLKHTENLSGAEKGVLYYFIWEFKYRFTSPVRLSEMADGEVKKAIRDHVGSLMEKGLIVSVAVADDSKVTKDNYRISPLCAGVFHGCEDIIDFKAVSDVATVIPHGEIREKNLYFSSEDLRSFRRFEKLAMPGTYERMQRALEEAGLRAGVGVLMSGPPGTGKTELCRQVARRSARNLMMTDAAKLNGSFFGEDERNYRNLFEVFRYLSAVSTRPPILLMDEADGILMKRLTSVQRASDRVANVVQSIILDEMSSLPGILVATTNLPGNLDEAMDRRFQIKLPFHLPDRNARRMMWKDRLKWLSNEDAATLADEFILSGGFMDNVATMSIMDQVLDEKQTTLDDLRRYCRESSVQQTERRKIGF